MMKYKNFIGHVAYDDEAEIFHGEVVNIRDVITFQGDSVESLNQAFKDSIDDYIEFCHERGEAPEKPFSGTFNLRLTPELHREVFTAAKLEGTSLNHWVVKAIEHELHVDR